MIASSTDELINSIPCALLNWYDFKKNAKVLYIGYRNDVYIMALKANNADVTIMDIGKLDEPWGKLHRCEYDYIVCIAYLELIEYPKQILRLLKKVIKPKGHLLLGMNNRLGTRFFCGDRDPYTGRNFDGVEGYRRAYSKKEDEFQGRCYSKAEIKDFLTETGWINHQFFSVFSGLENPSFIFSEDYLPNEDLSKRVFPSYIYPTSVFLEEEQLYETLIQNGLFHQMANAFLIDCSADGELINVLHVTESMERGKENALITVIRRDGVVEKRAVYPEAQKKLEHIAENANSLRNRGICVVDMELKNGVLEMPFINHIVGQVYLKQLLHTDRNRFLQEMDHFRDLILQSAEITKPDSGDGNGPILERGYIDMVPLNSFYIDNDFVFYDQEFCEENYPANVIIWRMIATFYEGDVEAQKILPRDVLLERYGLKKNLRVWQKAEWSFLDELKNTEKLRRYHELHRRDANIIHSNRQRMNYSSEDYQRLFVDIFKNADTRKLILFGSGNYTKKFLSLYKIDYPVYAIIDNNPEKWGQEIDGIRIESPKILNVFQRAEYKVIICIKNYLSVMKQLDKLGVGDYSVYDWNKDYPRKLRALINDDRVSGKVVSKKYHIGYVAGVFDMFHVGHINLLRKAKELCDYLIVGVVPDEGVFRQKNKYPVIPCEDRIEVLKACRYADQVEELPLDYAGIRDAYKMFHFDVQFSGDDHSDNPDWLADQEFLRKNGSDIVFFNYTKKVSSTKLREQLGR